MTDSTTSVLPLEEVNRGSARGLRRPYLILPSGGPAVVSMTF